MHILSFEEPLPQASGRCPHISSRQPSQTGVSGPSASPKAHAFPNSFLLKRPGLEALKNARKSRLVKARRGPVWRAQSTKLVWGTERGSAPSGLLAEHSSRDNGCLRESRE